MNKEFLIRIGMFLMLIGMYLFIIFVASDLAKKTDFDYLFGAVLLISIGWLLYRQKAPPPPSGRFEYLRKMRGGKKGGGESAKPKK